MLKLPMDARHHRKLFIIAIATPMALLCVYWFWMVGITDPATRLRRDLRSHAKKALIGRTPLTFIHQPINQWTLPMKDFYVCLRRDGTIRVSPPSKPEGWYYTSVSEPAAIAGTFEFQNVGTAVEIELIPAGRTAEVASVRPVP